LIKLKEDLSSIKTLKQLIRLF